MGIVNIITKSEPCCADISIKTRYRVFCAFLHPLVESGKLK